MSWLLSWLAVLPFVVTCFAHWQGLRTAARLLPKERLERDDRRVVPDLYSPESSHRWLGIILNERTDGYSPRLKRALALARGTLVLMPLAVVASVMLLGLVHTDASGAGGTVLLR